MRKRLQSALSKIHLSFDVWTSPNKILFLGICTHFVDRDSQQLFKTLIGLCLLTGHGEDKQAEVLIPGGAQEIIHRQSALNAEAEGLRGRSSGQG